MCLESLKKEIEILYQFYEKRRKLEEIFGGTLTIADDLDESYVNLLVEKYSDKYGWIEFYIFECDFGNFPKEYCIEDDCYIMDSIEKLYSVLKIK